MIRDYYKIMGLSAGCSLQEVKEAYRKLAFKYHPDVNGSEHAAGQFVIINEAYRILSNDMLRRNYDHLRKYGPSVPAKPAGDERKYGTAYKYRYKKPEEPPVTEESLTGEKSMFYILFVLGILSIFLSVNDLVSKRFEGMGGVTGMAFGITFTGLLLYGWYEFLRSNRYP